MGVATLIVFEKDHSCHCRKHNNSRNEKPSTIHSYSYLKNMEHLFLNLEWVKNETYISLIFTRQRPLDKWLRCTKTVPPSSQNSTYNDAPKCMTISRIRLKIVPDCPVSSPIWVYKIRLCHILYRGSKVFRLNEIFSHNIPKTFPKPSWSILPLAKIATNPANMTKIWKESVQTTALSPPIDV